MAAARRAAVAPVTAAVLLGMLAVAQALWLAVSARPTAAGRSTAAPRRSGGAPCSSWRWSAWPPPCRSASCGPAGLGRGHHVRGELAVARRVPDADRGRRWSRSWSRRTGSAAAAHRLLAAALAVPFLIARAGGLARRFGGRDPGRCCWPRSARRPRWPGAHAGPSADAIEHSAAREAIAGTLLEHTARGERARIARELHDVVAHHISMIAVQAETARLTTPGMPAAGAQRLSAIGDTARAALTEMRRLLGVLREDAETGVRGPSAAAGAAPAQRPARRGPGGVRDRDPADPARGPGHRSTRGSSSPPTGSSRRRSPTPGGTRPGPPSTWSCTTPTTGCGC